MTAGVSWAEGNRLPAVEGTELTDPGADMLPVVLQMAAEAEAAELELEA